jgi:VanZ family protein
MTITVFSRWAAWLLVLAVAIFTLSPHELRPITAGTTLSDTMERFTAFAVIGTLFGLGYPKRRFAIFLLVVGIVASLEVAQNFVPGRHGRLPDGLVKAAGALFGFATIMISKRKKAVP